MQYENKMKSIFPIDKFEHIKTPFYYYDTRLLQETLKTVSTEAAKKKNFHVHYAIKANANPKILDIIARSGLGADCVSGGEIEAAVKAGFPADKIVFAGVGKADREIASIFCFNVESIPELEIINELAQKKNLVANVCFRINPDVGAHTHANIKTGLAENKFGIAMRDMLPIIKRAEEMKNIKFIGLHFHIGSQILNMDDFTALCNRINELQNTLEEHHITVRNINVGGGLGIDYNDPHGHTIPDFKEYFDTYYTHLQLRPGQQVHFELGRSIVAQMGTLITRTLYVKQGTYKRFCIVDAGMTDLIRPALYHAHHSIENLSSNEPPEAYDVVGPICESSDVFDKDVELNKVHRGDLIAIRSAGAYGEIMACQYNCRPLPAGITAEDID